MLSSSGLYASLFKKPEPYIKVIDLLARKKKGMTRLELIAAGGFDDNGAFSDILKDLEWCGFIRSYSMMGYTSKSELFQLMDHYTLFYYEFQKGLHPSSNYWMSMIGKPQYNTWCGLAFERTALWHVEQIKRTLGISGIATYEYSWRCAANKEKGIEGTQIDLLIDRSDDIIDLCEVKYSKDAYIITADYALDLQRKRNVLADVTGTKSAIHTVMVTTEGVAHNAHWGEIQAEVALNDLFVI